MTRKLASNIFMIVFMVCFFTMVGFMVVGFIQQNKDEKQQISRYEQMITRGGENKTVLTSGILEEDHEKYLQDAEKSKSTFIKLLICFACVAVLFVLLAIFNAVQKAMDESGPSLVIALVSFLAVTFMISSFAVIAGMFLVPRLKTDPSKEAYYFDTLIVKDAVREEEKVNTGSGADYQTETRVYYYLLDESGNKISVSKLLYERYTGPGTYYAGRTARGNIFSLYSGEYFELENDLKQ